MVRLSFILGLLLFLPSRSPAVESPKALLYQPQQRGSNSVIHPLTMYFNMAFDTAQNPFYFTQAGFLQNHKVLYQRIRSPFSEIEKSGGFGKFFLDEFITHRSLPNYGLHLMGGGYDFRLLAEWFEARDYPLPYVLAFLTTYLGNIGNEALETTASVVPPTDQIADLYFFDIVGKLLFLNDDFVRFAQNKLQMRSWPFQPVLDVTTGYIENAGANWVFRPKLFGENWRPFFYLGLQIMGGVSYKWNERDSLSLGAGLALTDAIRAVGYFVTGIFWDRDDSLMASLILNGSSNLRFRLNVYPIQIPETSIRVGLFSGFNRDDVFFVGTHLYLPMNIPLGLGASGKL